VKYLDWDAEKNRKLIKERGISFEEVKIAVESGRLLDIFNHPNQKRYPGQRIWVVDIDSYIYLVPFIEDEKKYFLKTIFPSRKATKKYLKDKSLKQSLKL
jgi:uncharacterized DUF497 family protein